MNKHAARLICLSICSLSIALFAGTHIASAQSPSSNHWRGGILFDEDFRAAFRLAEVGEQETARTISDIALGATILTAGVDGSIVPLAQGNTDLAWQAQFAHALALGITMSGGEVVKRMTSRARPYERECAARPERAGCRDSDTFESFYSLHSGVAFTSAGFSCSMHLSRSLYGDLAADATSCAISLAMATTTGLLRVLSDRHYLSDVLIGAALGFLVGYVVPLAIVPERGVRPDDVAPPGQSTIGLSFSGEF